VLLIVLEKGAFSAGDNDSPKCAVLDWAGEERKRPEHNTQAVYR